MTNFETPSPYGSTWPVHPAYMASMSISPSGPYCRNQVPLASTVALFDSDTVNEKSDVSLPELAFITPVQPVCVTITAAPSQLGAAGLLTTTHVPAMLGQDMQTAPVTRRTNAPRQRSTALDMTTMLSVLYPARSLGPCGVPLPGRNRRDDVCRSGALLGAKIVLLGRKRGRRRGTNLARVFFLGRGATEEGEEAAGVRSAPARVSGMISVRMGMGGRIASLF